MKNRLSAVILMVAALFPLTAGAQVPAPGVKAPAFSLPDMDSKVRSLADYHGTVVLIVFWATWCTPCTAKMPALEKLYGAFKEKGLTVLAVSQDGRSEAVKSYLRNKRLSFTVLMDPEKETSFDLYAVTGLPAAFLVSRNGVILEKFIGEQDWGGEKVRRTISEALAEKRSDP